MILSINTTNRDKIEIALKEGERVVVRKEFEAKYSQAEKLLPAVDKMLASKKIKLNGLKEKYKKKIRHERGCNDLSLWQVSNPGGWRAVSGFFIEPSIPYSP